MLKLVYLLKKQSNVRDNQSIVCKCMRTSLLHVVVCLYSMSLKMLGAFIAPDIGGFQ